MINITIFSKNRACQLEFLLRSMITYWASLSSNINVIYTTTNPIFEKGYSIVKDAYPLVKFINQTDFKANVKDAINVTYPFTIYFVDDNVFKFPFNEEDGKLVDFYRNKDLLCISMRMHPGITFCYTENKPTPPPTLSPELTWTWRGLPGDWGYPMSLDGHIFRTSQILPLIDNLNYSNPNTMEAALAGCPLGNPLMMCYNNSIIMNIPINKVQTVNNNRHGNVSAESLNNIFLQGHRLSLSEIDRMVNISAHQEVNLKII